MHLFSRSPRYYCAFTPPGPARSPGGGLQDEVSASPRLVMAAALYRRAAAALMHGESHGTHHIAPQVSPRCVLACVLACACVCVRSFALYSSSQSVFVEMFLTFLQHVIVSSTLPFLTNAPPADHDSLLPDAPLDLSQPLVDGRFALFRKSDDQPSRSPMSPLFSFPAPEAAQGPYKDCGVR